MINEKLNEWLNEEKDLNGSACISISSVLGLIKEPFDQMGVATKTYNKHHNNPDSEYFGMTIEQIIEKWSAKGAQSTHYGNMLDTYIGINLNNQTDELELFNLDYDRDGDERLNNVCTSFDEFKKEFLDANPNIKFVDREKNVFYKIPETGQYVMGRFDALFYDEDKKKYIIVDWKSSGTVDKIPSKWTGKLLGPCKDLLDLNWYSYSIQVYFYKTALENSGMLKDSETVDCIIVQLPGHIIEESQKMYCIHHPAFNYDKNFMDKLFVWAHKKNMILKKNGK